MIVYLSKSEEGKSVTGTVHKLVAAAAAQSQTFSLWKSSHVVRDSGTCELRQADGK